MARHWPPSRYLPDYTGEYPRHELEQARQTLINCLQYNRSAIIERVKPKLGLSSSYGPGLVPPPTPQLSQGPAASSSPSPQRHVFANSSQHLQHSASFSSLSVDCSPSGSDISTCADNIPVRPAPAAVHRNLLVPIPRADADDSHSVTNIQPVIRKHKLSMEETEDRDSAKHCKLAFGTETVTGSVTPAYGASVSSSTTTTTTTTAPDDNDEVIATVQLVYKCDFCSFTALLSSKMNDHLVNTQHFSGSIYCAESKPGTATGYKLLSIHKMLAVKNKYSKAKALVVVCPECKDIYEDIFMCGMHYKYKHGTPNGFYSICPVIYHETVTVPVEPICQKCEQTFPKQRGLHLHWSQDPTHHPIAKPASERVFVLFICPYCRKTFYNNFLNCKGHVIDLHKSNGAVSRGLMAVEIKHVLLPMRKEELPPFNTSDESDGIKDELTILHNMKRHFKEMSGQKTKLLEITSRILHLQTLSAGN